MHPSPQLSDSAGRDSGPAGRVRGFVSGSFFHAIALHDSNYDDG